MKSVPFWGYRSSQRAIPSASSRWWIRRRGVFDDTHQTLLEWLAASAAIAIDNARLYERAREAIRQKEKAKEAMDKSVQRLHQTLNGTIQAMALIVEIKDPYTAGHQRRVASLAQAMGKKLGLSEARIETLPHLRTDSLISAKWRPPRPFSVNRAFSARTSSP